MKTVVLTAIDLVLILFVGHALGQTQPQLVGIGNTLTFEIIKPEQVGSDPVVFVKKPDLKVTLVGITEDGDREYRNQTGEHYTTTDKFLTKLTYRGSPIEEGYRFAHFPPGKYPESGQEWSVSFKAKTDRYGDNIITYHAVAREGPIFKIFVDGKETQVPTIRVDYTGHIKSTTNPGWNGTGEVHLLYAPSLNEIVSNEFISFSQGILLRGYRVTLKSIKTR
jgi:hypothetical protein